MGRRGQQLEYALLCAKRVGRIHICNEEFAHVRKRTRWWDVLLAMFVHEKEHRRRAWVTRRRVRCGVHV